MWFVVGNGVCEGVVELGNNKFHVRISHTKEEEEETNGFSQVSFFVSRPENRYLLFLFCVMWMMCVINYCNQSIDAVYSIESKSRIFKILLM